MNVLISAYACGPNSVSEPGVAWQQLEALARIGQDNFVVLTRKKFVAPIKEECERLGLNNVEPLGVDFPAWALFWKRGHLSMHVYYGLWQCLGWFEARKIIKERQIELAHHLSFMSVRTSFVPFLGLPSIIGPVGGAQLAPAGFGSVLGHRAKETIRKLAVYSLKVSPWWRLCVQRCSIYIIANRDNAWVFPESAKKNLVVHQIGWRVEKVEPRDEVCDVKSRGLRIYWGGRLIGWKGLEILLRAMSVSRSRGTDVKLDVTGKGPDRAHLEQLARDLKINDVVRFHGFVPFSQAATLRDGADVVAFTSLHETTGTALMEAMAAGKATIVVNHAGPGEIADKSSSWLVPVDVGLENAVNVLAEGLDLLASDSKRVKEMGRAGRDRILNDFNWSDHIRFIRESYRRVVDARDNQ